VVATAYTYINTYINTYVNTYKSWSGKKEEEGRCE
jgi:hypothetical protein